MQPNVNVFEDLNQQNSDDVMALKAKQDKELNELKAHVQAIFANHGDEPITDAEYDDIRQMSKDLRAKHDQEADILYAFQKQRMINRAAEAGIPLPEFIETKPSLPTTLGESYADIWNYAGDETPDIQLVLVDVVVFLRNKCIKAIPTKRKGISVMIPIAHITKAKSNRLVPVRSYIPMPMRATFDARLDMALLPYKGIMAELVKSYNQNINLEKNLVKFNRMLREDEDRRKAENELQLWQQVALAFGLDWSNLPESSGVDLYEPASYSKKRF